MILLWFRKLRFVRHVTTSINHDNSRCKNAVIPFRRHYENYVRQMYLCTATDMIVLQSVCDLSPTSMSYYSMSGMILLHVICDLVPTSMRYYSMWGMILLHVICDFITYPMWSYSLNPMIQFHLSRDSNHISIWFYSEYQNNKYDTQVIDMWYYSQ